MTDFERLAPGTDIDGFIIDAVVGEGGFGTVYRAHHPNGDAVAIKVFKHEAAKLSTDALASQQNEIEALFRLNHPSLVRMQRYGYLPGGGLWVAMELVEGEPLNRYLRARGRLETLEVIRIVGKVAEALAHCHSLNIVHLDLKPQNIILVDPHEPRVKVLDFGLAHIEGSWKPTDSRVRAGTIAYMAPEVLRHNPAASTNPRVDLHALGIIFYELLAGRLPFEFNTSNELIERKQSGTILPLRRVAPDVPEAVERIVLRLLATDPAERPGNAAWLVAHLRDLYFSTLGDAETSEARSQPPPTVVTPEHVPLLGRETELDRLRSAFASVCSGEGRAIAVIGGVGLGKSRLIAEFLNDEAVSSRALVAYGRGRELQGLAAYSPLREALGRLAAAVMDAQGQAGDALRRATAHGIAADAALLVTLISELRQLVAQPRSEDAAIRLMSTPHVSRAIHRMIGSVAESRPVVLVLEDLDRADEGTLRVVRQLVDRRMPAGVLLLLTSRVDMLGAGDAAVRLVLAPFNEATNSEHLACLVPGATHEMLARLKQSIPLLDAGNPLFNTQVLRNLETEHHLTRTPSGELTLAAALGSDYMPPESVSAALRRTLETLNPDLRNVLSVAALFGPQFAVGDLTDLDLFPEDIVRRAVAEAARHYLCRITGETCVFVHESIRDYLEALAGSDRRPELHGRIARQLQRRGAPAAVLAYHLERAGRAAEASRSYLEAGLESDSLHDPVGACRHLARAVDLLSTLAHEGERNTLVLRTAYELSRIGCLAGNTAETLADLNRCAALLDMSVPEHAIVLEAAYARVFYAQGDFQQAVSRSRACLALIEQHPEFASYACVPTNILGRVMIASGRPRPAIALLTKGCDLARSAREYVELAHSEGVLSVALATAGDYARAHQYIASCEQLAARLGDPLRLAGAYFYYSVLAETRFDWPMGIKYTTRLLAYAEQHGIGGLYLLMGTMYAGRHQFHVGRLHRAEVLLLNALNLSTVTGIAMGVGWTHAFLGDVHFTAGRFGHAHLAYMKAVEIGNHTRGRDEYAAGLGLIGIAHCAAVAKQRHELGRRAEEAISRLREAGLNAVLAHAFQRYAQAAEVVGDIEVAARARAEERAQFDRLGVAPCAWQPRVADAQVIARAADATPSSASTVASDSRETGVLGASAIIDEPTSVHASNLMEVLSTVQGFVPPFTQTPRHMA